MGKFSLFACIIKNWEWPGDEASTGLCDLRSCSKVLRNNLDRITQCYVTDDVTARNCHFCSERSLASSN